MVDRVEQQTPLSPLTITRFIQSNRKEYVIAEYERGRFIDKGGFSEVYEVRQFSSGISKQDVGRVFLVKEMPLNNDRNRYMIQNEISVLEYLNEMSQSKYFVKLHDYWRENKTKYYITFEKYLMGSLYDLIQQSEKKKRPLDKQIILYLVYQILKALQILRSLHIVHRDLKLQNVLLDDNLSIKIIDFGSARRMHPKVGNKLLVVDSIKKHGTPLYMAPQLMSKFNTFNEKVDVWGLGVSLYYILFGKYPFTININEQSKQSKFTLMQNKILSQQIVFQEDHDRIRKNNYKQLVDLVKMMLIKDVQKRKSVDQILDMEIWKNMSNVKNIKQKLYNQYLIYFSHRGINRTTWRQDLKQQMLALPIECIDYLKDQTKVKIIKAVHLKRFGFFVLLSNCKIYGYFNDHDLIKYQAQNQINNSEVQKIFQLYNNKLKILAYVKKKYFDEELKNEDNTLIFHKQYFHKQYCSIYKIFFQKNHYFVRLNNQVLQIFFKKTDQEQEVIRRSITLNYNKLNKNQILFVKDEKQYKYQSYEHATQIQSICKKYVQYIKKVLCVILDNSQISFENYGYERIRIKNM